MTYLGYIGSLFNQLNLIDLSFFLKLQSRNTMLITKNSLIVYNCGAENLITINDK